MKNRSLHIVIPLIFALVTSCTSGSNKKVTNEQKKVISTYLSPREDTIFFSLLNLDFPGMEEVKERIEKGDPENAKAAYLDFRRNKSRAKWDINPSDKPDKPSERTYPQADRIMKHLIEPSMSAPEAFIGEDINWEFNPVVATEPHFTKEWTWCNLNRMPFWNTLGTAYWKTLDEKYAVEWIDQMVDWVEDNPVPLEEGPSSTLTWRTIESGIRMAGSWMNAYYYFLNSPSFTPDAHATFIKGVMEHSQRLEKITRDFPERSGNWVTMECNGLGTIGILFPEFKNSDEIIKVAFDKLNDELDKQVYPDGAQVELTPGYHQVSRSNFMELAKLAQINDVPLPGEYLAKLKKMYEFNLYLMDPGGILPPFNDAGPTRTASSLREGYEIWKDEQFLFGATLGKEGTKPPFDSYFFNYAGYYVMRSGWNYNDNCLYFDAGPVGYGHEHEDMLNLYLYSAGRILLTEPGTYSYDLSKWRRYILSTPSHNTIIVDGKEQHRGDMPESRFISEPLKNPWLTSPLFDYGSGTYSSGYQENKYKAVQYMPREYIGEKDTTIKHTRHVVFLRPFYYVAVDLLEGSGKHTYDAHFHLDAPDAAIDQTTMSVRTLREDSVQLALFPMDLDNLQAKIVKGQEEPVLGWLPGKKRMIPTVVYTKTEEAPATFSTLIYPYFNVSPDISYSKIPDGNNDLWGENINTPFEEISLIIRKNGKNRPVEIETGNHPAFITDSKVIILRKPAGKNQEYAGFYNISEFRDKTLSFTLLRVSSLVIVRENEKELMIYNPDNTDIEARFSLPIRKRVTLPVKKWVTVSVSGIEELNEQINLF